MRHRSLVAAAKMGPLFLLFAALAQLGMATMGEAACNAGPVALEGGGKIWKQRFWDAERGITTFKYYLLNYHPSNGLKIEVQFGAISDFQILFKLATIV